MRKINVSRDDTIYEAWPDIAKMNSGRLVCVFSECKHHRDRDQARLVYKISDDNGETWSEKYYLTKQGTKDAYFNCARITNLADGRLVILCDFLENENNADSMRNYLWFSSDGISWTEPKEIPIRGIVPDFCELKSGRWIAAAHHKMPETDKLAEFMIYSDDCGETWSKQSTIASDERYNLCEASLLEIEPNVIVAFMRENSSCGYDCFKAISYDAGNSWEGVFNVPLPGCHRPKAGLLSDGRILITYRFMQGGKGWLGAWTQNMFGAIMPYETALATKRNEQSARIFPIDFDRSTVSDIGYTGWVQFNNGEVYVVDYLVDDAPKAYIRASVFSIDEFII